MELNSDAIKDDLARRHPRRMRLLDIFSRLMLSLISSADLSVLWDAFKGTHPGMSSVGFLPIIDMNPSDMSCICTTLTFVVTECQSYYKRPILTFDQPLFWKAQLMVAGEQETRSLRSIVLKLDGFPGSSCLARRVSALRDGCSNNLCIA